MEEAIPVMNVMNAPLELCEQVKERFLQFLNGFVLSDSLDAEPSQSITHSQGSGGAWRGAGGRRGGSEGRSPWPTTPDNRAHGCWGAGGHAPDPLPAPDI